uniref:Structural polyprotein n=1 Tax=Robinvale bee virus 1 TaxID=2201312 RepID=A0A2U8JQA0_9VIRU|nr:structural polyprotein [Robinvale bee virus 1]
MSLNIEQIKTTNMDTSINNTPSNPTLTGNPETYQNDTVEFLTEGAVPQVAMTNQQNAQDQYFVNADPVSHEISDIMSRPYRLHSGVWKSGSPLGTALFSDLVVASLRSSPAYSKLQGFMAFTATFCFRLVINSQPTQAGMLMLAFRPDETDEDTSSFRFWNKTSDPSYLLARISGCPNATLSLASASQCEFRVAYRATTPLCDVSRGEFGKLDLRVLSTLMGPDNNQSVSYSIYMWLEDLKTYGTQPYTEPSTFTMRAAKTQGRTILPTVAEAKKACTAREAKTQGKTVPSAIEAAKKGDISKIADTVGSVASALTAVPVLADIAGPVSWAAKGVSSIASMFGLSKPHDITPSAAVTNNPYKDFAHGVGANACETKLTLNDASELSVRPLGAVEEDEMNIKYLTQIPIYLSNRTWKTTDAVDKIIFNCPVAPQYMISRAGQVSGKAMTVHTTLSYLALIHRFWRGTIKLTFNVVGTKFHAGRLRATFTPSHSYTPAQQHQYTYSKIIDIQDDNTFTLINPWVKELPLRSTDRMTNYEQIEGYFTLSVEDQLVANSTCSQQVDIVTFVSGDCSFVAPRIPDEHPANGVAFVASQREAKTQGFTLNTALSPTAEVSMVPHDTIPTAAQEQRALEVTVGDPEPSLRVLAKRMAFNGLPTFTKNTAETREHIILPSNQLQSELRLATSTDKNMTYGDYVDWVSALYRFRSGGIRYCIYGDLPRPENTLIKFCPFDGTNNIIPAAEITAAGIGTFESTIERFMQMLNYTTVPYAKNNYGIQVSIPYYHDRPALINSRWFIPNPLPITTTIAAGSNPTSTCDSFLAISNFSAIDSDLTKNRVWVFRAAADDFNCGFFCGPPITYRNIPKTQSFSLSEVKASIGKQA